MIAIFCIHIAWNVFHCIAKIAASDICRCKETFLRDFRYFLFSPPLPVNNSRRYKCDFEEDEKTDVRLILAVMSSALGKISALRTISVLRMSSALGKISALRTISVLRMSSALGKIPARRKISVLRMSSALRITHISTKKVISAMNDLSTRIDLSVWKDHWTL